MATRGKGKSSVCEWSDTGGCIISFAVQPGSGIRDQASEKAGRCFGPGGKFEEITLRVYWWPEDCRERPTLN